MLIWSMGSTYVVWSQFWIYMVQLWQVKCNLYLLERILRIWLHNSADFSSFVSLFDLRFGIERKWGCWNGKMKRRSRFQNWLLYSGFWNMYWYIGFAFECPEVPILHWNHWVFRLLKSFRHSFLVPVRPVHGNVVFT